MPKIETTETAINHSEGKNEVVSKCASNDAQLLKLTKKQLSEIDLYLGIISKIVPLSFALFVILGGMAIWLYLAKLNLTSEFSQLISTYQVLFQISFFSLALTALLVFALIIGPLIYRSASDELYLPKHDRLVFVSDIIIISSNMSLQLILASYVKDIYEWLMIIPIIITAITIVTIRPKFVNLSFHKRDIKLTKKLYVGVAYIMSLFLMLLPLSLMLLAASKTLPDTIIGYFVVAICLIAYSAIAALLIERNNKAIIVLFMLVLAPLCIFQDQSINFFLQHYGLSQYSATMSFDNKYTTILDNNIEIRTKKIPNSVEQSTIYHDIWVVLDTPSAIILSATSASRTFVELPKTAITGKLVSREGTSKKKTK